ncbi:member of major facilitator multidrug-resistance DHA1 sub-family [Russula earlei]|uniref:Member of major facilitator multidrug-resistance DHA1 sub-family n=1 Tax=Russula earlei TaxID=71964 RepID=A0ACC0UKI0_9AGAM|nr:member of major facilitator multidrug-resistance DHA1 sub-family [Russula earlei]
MSTMARDDVLPSDEETPLLSPELVPRKQPTPVPWAQIWILLVLQLVEPLTSQVIYPFTPEFVRNVGITHGDETRVGYYVGMMQSIFFATQALTVLHWSRLSDVVGRKPIILTGVFGLSLSMYSFGLSTTYWGATISRSLNGALNGNIGIIKSIVAEITDPTNLPQVFAFMPVAWSTGGALGTTIGGSLSRPAESFPDIFGNSEFLKKYPYFLPCAVTASFSALTWMITFVFLQETVPSPQSLRTLLTGNAQSSSFLGSSETDDAEKPYPLSQLMTRRVLLSVLNYATLSLVDISFRAIQPLFFSTPIHIGGLGLDPPSIGKILAFSAILNGVFQVTCFARAHALWGTKRLFVGGLCCAIPMFALFPVMNALTRVYGVGLVVYSAAALQAVWSLGLASCYGCVFISISAASPNRASLGATNGIAQLLVSITRAIGPAAATSLFSLSLAEGYVSGGMVYLVLLGVSLATIVFGTTLPMSP